MPLPGEGVVNPRREMMEAIVKNRTTEVVEQIKEGGGDGNLETTPVTDEDPLRPETVSREDWSSMSDEAKGQAIASEKKPEPEVKEEKKEEEAPPVVEAKPKVKIKVDGQEQEVDEDKVREAGIRALQKESAADKRLEEAARLKKEAEQMLATAKPQDQDTRPSTDGAVIEKLTDDHYLKAVKAIQYGSEAEASTALKGLIAEAAKSGQSDDLTLSQVGEYLEFREATKWAHDEYKDILGDPKLKALFSAEEKRMRAAGDMRPYRDIYQDIGGGLRDWIKGKAPQPESKPVNGLEARKERKATVVNVPSAAARQPAPPQQKEKSPSDVINEMRARRFQA